MSEVYKMKIAGLDRELPICKVNDNMDIAAFVMFDDVELTIKAAEMLLKKCPEFDYVITAEAKGIPLAYEMARQANKGYVVARKGVKLYMKDPVFVQVRSITTDHMQTLYLDRDEMERIKGKKVLIADDVISTGESLNALRQLVRKAGGEIIGEAAVIAEGDASNLSNIIYLDYLPLFFK